MEIENTIFQTIAAGFTHFFTDGDILLILLMTAAGVLGGAVNHISARNDKRGDDAPSDEEIEFIQSSKHLRHSILLGVAASFMVPLFLMTASSSLVGEVLNGAEEQTAQTARKASGEKPPPNAQGETPKRNPAAPFVFFGFCLLASISSRPFIRNLSGKIFKDDKGESLIEESENGTGKAGKEDPAAASDDDADPVAPPKPKTPNGTR